MLQTIRARAAARRGHDEAGFTLIELMVVVLIIAILLAIAIPTFLGAQNKAKDRDAQSSLRNMLTAATTAATDSQGDYSAATTAVLSAAEPNYTFGDPSDGPKKISVLAEKTQWSAAAWSNSGKCFFITVSASGTKYGTTTTAADCTGAKAKAGATANGW